MSYLLPVLVVLLPGVAGAATALGQRGRSGGAGARSGSGRLVVTALALGALAASALVATTARSGGLVTGDVGATTLLQADRARAILALLTLAVGVTVVAWARRALAGDEREARWYALTATLVAATATTALAGNLVVLALAWVATSAALVALVGHRGSWRRARLAQRQVGLLLGVGDASLVGAVVLTATLTGSVQLTDPADLATRLADQGWGLHAVAMLLVVAGISRSALVPLHRWLPTTLVAPTPVSAILHAGVINGAGVLLLATAPIAGRSVPAMAVLFAAGAATAVLATAIMLARADAKGALAWSTAGQMGFMTVQIAVGALGAALFHIVGHALYKAALFLGAGSAVDAATAERRLPHTGPVTNRERVQLIAVAFGAGAAMIAAVDVIAPAGPAAGTLLIVVFGWLTAVQLSRGWLTAGDRSAASFTAALVLALAAPWAYVGALAGFKSFVDAPLLASGAGSVGVVPVVAVVVATAAAAASVAWLPGPVGLALRRRVTGTLLGTGTVVAAGARPVSTTRPAPAMRIVPAATTPELPSDEITWRSTA